MAERQWTAGERWAELKLLQKEYAEFSTFLFDVIEGLMGFKCTAVQLDIAAFLEHGPQYRMIQAQRGQAKTTITAAYAVWRQIQDPTTRVLIISSGSDMATEISGWIIQIIMGMEELECLRPDRSTGDRASVKAFDIHHELKGPEKSPSVACVGITSNLQGKRADLLIADDIESSKNSMTEVQRARLVHLTRDFISICSLGEIIYLGTPQSIDSVYNGLYSRGYVIRIWPGRYPTQKEQDNYGEHLAPSIAAAVAKDPTLRTGGGPMSSRGQATDPVLLPEDVLIAKEIDQGAAYFQLQHMLDTRLSDAERFPLKSAKIVFMHISRDRAPLHINFQPSPPQRVHTPADWPITDHYYRASGFGEDFAPFVSTHMYVDPAGGGQNGDETAYAVSKMLGGKIFLVDEGGVPGGLDHSSLDMLTEIAVEWKPHQVDIEENYGKGALSAVWTPLLQKEHACEIVDVWETGQKELRIIDTLEPIIGAGRLVVDEGLLAKDWEATVDYPISKRTSYSFWYQLSRITRERGALTHDDRLDAVAGTCRHWIDSLKVDEDQQIKAAKRAAYEKMMRNPLGNGRTPAGWNDMMLGRNRSPNAFNRNRRRF